MIEIWGRDGCGFCEAAKELCERTQLKYSYYKLNQDFTREELIERFPNAKTYPQITVQNSHVGGYTEFAKYLEETGYNGSGYTL